MISVCMATYNGANFIKEQIESILHQIGDEDEIVISDDSSTDNTIEIVESLNDRRIKIIRNQKFHSPIYNFENAIKQSHGDYIFLADQDDVWCPNKIKEILPFLDKYLLVHTNAQIVDSDLIEIRPRIFDNVPKTFLGCLIKNPYLGCTLAFRKEVKELVLPFPPKIAMHDIWIGLCVHMFKKPYFLNKNLIQYRRHGNNCSNTSTRSKYSFKYKISYRLYLLKSLALRYVQICSKYKL